MRDVTFNARRKSKAHLMLFNGVFYASRLDAGCFHRTRCIGQILLLARRFVSNEFDSGPLKGSLSAIPFQVSREKAAAAFKEYHKGHIFSAKPSAGLQKIKESFLPFWITTASASIQLNAAQVGFDRWVTHWNPQTRRQESRLETQWHWVDLQRAFWEQRYSSRDMGMQVYASYKYPRREINRLRPSGAVQIAQNFESRMVVSEFDGSTRRVGPFQMKPAVAVRFVREWIEGEEAERARSLVRSSFRCDRVGQLKMDVRLSDVRTAPVYVPAFVFRSTHFGAKLRTFVSGVSAEGVTGTRALDETRVGLVGGLLGGLALLASGAYVGMSAWSIWVWGIALPATLTGFAARNYTALRNRWQLYWLESERMQ